MPTHSSPIVLSTRATRTFDRQRRAVHRSAVLVMAVVASGTFGACNNGSSDDGPTAPGAERRDHVGPQGGDVAGVTAVVLAWDAAWNAGDAPGLGATFVADAEFVNGRGGVVRGDTAIGAQHAASLAGPFQGSRTVSHIRAITFLTGAAAVVDVDNELTGFRAIPPGAVFTEPGLNRQRHKRVVVRQGGAWRVQSMQLTTVAPAP